MSVSVTIWLGLAFAALAVAAVALQAWLWGFPFDHEKHRSLAPRGWTNLHRVIGFAYVAVYVVMMTEMVPRLWQYQVELSARTVVHACLGITIGVILLIKLSIIRFFRHFEESMPTLGVILLICSLVMVVLSLPYSLRARAAFAGEVFEPKNRERTRTLIGGLDFGYPVDVGKVASVDGLLEGRDILTGKCVTCHDLRTVLIKPRPADGWLDVVDRMADKPNLGRAITDDDIPRVVAYLVAITPNLEESTSRRRAGERKQKERAAEVASALAPNAPEASPASIPTSNPASLPAASDPAAKKLFETTCSQCHKLAKVDKHGRDNEAGWRKVVARMVEENDAEIDAPSAQTIARYLGATRGK